MIPKVIHQTWKTAEIPDDWKVAVESCKRMNPSFKHYLWTHETMDQFMKTHYPSHYTLYRSYPYDIQRCDAFRYFVLYTYGGVYLDLDIVCNQSLDPLLQYDLVLARSYTPGSSFTNAFYMVSPKHPFIKHCMDQLSKTSKDYNYLGKHLHVINSTGPSFLSSRLKDYGDIPNSYIFKREEYSGDCSLCNEHTCKGGSYFTHIPGMSWNGFDSALYNFLYCNQVTLYLMGIIILLNVTKKRKKFMFSP